MNREGADRCVCHGVDEGNGSNQAVGAARVADGENGRRSPGAQLTQTGVLTMFRIQSRRTTAVAAALASLAVAASAAPAAATVQSSPARLTAAPSAQATLLLPAVQAARESAR